MTLSEYRDTHSWKQAIELAPKLMQLAEELPASEEHGLSKQLRKAMVEVSATIAADLMLAGPGGGQNTRLLPLLRLQATLELIDRVYPALDTAATRTAADQLAERLTGANFAERASMSGATVQPALAAIPAPVQPAPAPVAPVNVPVIPADTTPTPSLQPQEDHVQPDSEQ